MGDILKNYDDLMAGQYLHYMDCYSKSGFAVSPNDENSFFSHKIEDSDSKHGYKRSAVHPNNGNFEHLAAVQRPTDISSIPAMATAPEESGTDTTNVYSIQPFNGQVVPTLYPENCSSSSSHGQRESLYYDTEMVTKPTMHNQVTIEADVNSSFPRWSLTEGAARFNHHDADGFSIQSGVQQTVSSITSHQPLYPFNGASTFVDSSNSLTMPHPAIVNASLDGDVGTGVVHANGALNSEKKSFKCIIPGCEKILSRSDALHRHMESVHRKDRVWCCGCVADGEYVTWGCGQVFTRQDAMVQHFENKKVQCILQAKENVKPLGNINKKMLAHLCGPIGTREHQQKLDEYGLTKVERPLGRSGASKKPRARG